MSTATHLAVYRRSRYPKPVPRRTLLQELRDEAVSCSSLVILIVLVTYLFVR